MSLQDRQDHRSDPYRSAYSQQHHHQQQQYHQQQQQQYQQSQQQQQQHSPYYDLPAPLEEMNQTAYSSRYSLSSGHGGGSGDGGAQLYRMRALHSHDSNPALSASFQRQSGVTPASSVYGGQGERYPDGENASLTGTTVRYPSDKHYQYTLTASHPSQQRLKDDEDEDENAEILHKISSRSETRSGISQSSLPSKRRRNQTHQSNSEDSEEEGQERGALRHRDSKRCYCCSRRLCVYASFVFVLCLAVTLYFVVPRSPAFSFESVLPMGDPIVTNNRIQEAFSLQMRVDSQENYVPVRFTSIEMTVWMKIDQKKIGSNEGLPSSFVIKPKAVQVVSVPMTIDYTSLMIDINADGTLQKLIGACKPVSPNSGAYGEGINLTFGGKLHVWGLNWIWKPQFSFNVDNVPCPVNARDPSTSSTLQPSTGGTGTGTGAGTSTGGTSATMSQTGSAATPGPTSQTGGTTTGPAPTTRIPTASP
ncbi:hypothetical protein EDD11_010251 [Mortierella claussenii]|nr:hypothetical protein EDD11_010251 [Mortierella claussenii]